MSATPGKPKPPQKPASSSSYSPSVPISVYRELATEMQATKAMLQAVNAQNQQLLQQNQQLRHELDRIVKTAVNVQQAIATMHPVSPVEPSLTATTDPSLVDSLLTVQKPKDADPPMPEAESDPEVSVSESDRTPTPSATQPHSDPEPQSPSQGAELPNFGDRLFSEIKEEPRPSDERSKPRDLGGLWLTLTIVVIMVTAFGAGFLVMRPFLPSNNNR